MGSAVRSCGSMLLCLAALTSACDNFVDGYYNNSTAVNSEDTNNTVGNSNSTTSNANVLVVANYSNGETTYDSLGGPIACDNCTLSNVSGQLHFAYASSGTYFGVSNVLHANWCEYDISGYSTLKFDFRSSVDGRDIEVILHEGDGTCPANPPTVATWHIVATTTMQTFSIPLASATARKYAISIELDPQALDGTDYTLNNVELVP